MARKTPYETVRGVSDGVLEKKSGRTVTLALSGVGFALGRVVADFGAAAKAVSVSVRSFEYSKEAHKMTPK